jgi:hypothetical protein
MSADEDAMMFRSRNREDDVDPIGRRCGRDGLTLRVAFADDLFESVDSTFDFQKDDIVAMFQADIGRSTARPRNRGLDRHPPP